MNLIKSSELHKWISENVNFQLIDVREDYEYDEKNIGGINMPLNDILDRIGELPSDKPIVLCCKSGKRSGAMAHTLERKFSLSNILSLEGGLETYFQDYS